MVAAHTLGVAHDALQDAYDLLPVGVIIVDATGTIVVANQSLERLLGYDRVELVGQSIERLVPKHLDHAHRMAREAYAHHAVARPMGAGRELLARHRDGHEIPVEIGLSPLIRGAERFVVTTIAEVTERRHLEEQLQQMQKEVAIGNLAAGIAHDFNNILLGILGYAELAQGVVGSSSAISPHLADIIENAQRGSELVGRILSFARKKNAVRRGVRWDAVIADSLRLMRVSLPANVGVHVDSELDLPKVLADPTELQQIFINLLTNAIHASSPKGGAIEVSLSTCPPEVPSSDSSVHLRSCVCLSVIDAGTGMPQHVLEQIFEPYFTTKPPGEGTGLGLSVTQRIVRGLGGTMNVESQEGRGTRVDVILPGTGELGDVGDDAVASEDADAHEDYAS